MIRWGPERARTRPWRGDEKVAFLHPVPEGPLPSAAFVRRCLDVLAEQGFSRVVTGALSPREMSGFLDAGFGVEEELHLLSHDLRHLPERAESGIRGPERPADMRLRRARRDEWPQVLTVDASAFPPFWRLDGRGLSDAVCATPRAHFQVAVRTDGPLVTRGGPTRPPSLILGYCVMGRSGRSGFLQRLAVDPAEQGQHLGSALVIDGLRWLRRWRADNVVVNTQHGNTAALALYERVGFRRQPVGLSVLSAGIDS